MGDITKIKVNGEPESSYQLYPRNEEFAKRSEGAQPDWNQNDETKPDYVKNRPFYTGDPVETVLFNESFVFTIIGMGPMGERGVYNGATDFSPEIGQTYQVSWDGAVYSCVGTEYNSLIALGNLSIMNFGSDTGEPFLMTCGTGIINIYTWPAHSSHTISIGKMVVPVVKIDPKYLPDNPLNITGATVGQIAKITAVDDSGKPTAWESVDMPSVGGGGDASSADVFIIHATPDGTDTNAQLDKTTEQIYEAYQSGKYCLVSFIDQFIPVVSVETNGARAFIICYGFTFNKSGQGRTVGFRFTTNDGITWTPSFENTMLYNVCFKGLQIYGSGGQLYTISVDADGNLTATVAT